ncbi:uncharacterized protein C8Q71DRAFT_120726 [Rhodofomes roseus]|uniref:Uncharacterized protein n=1 Tax=Rhodofomes roseus TaxID=34475 RepID=A0ABQ8KCX6_9APHY|nr:uncharacterized protein C8Q71DRAFT_120726 [Rhodofomes roseus]KAH9835455.1 hypothetical protein C8Q71DRAFT_120726 [Rhodofomes roseus]
MWTLRLAKVAPVADRIASTWTSLPETGRWIENKRIVVVPMTGRHLVRYSHHPLYRVPGVRSPPEVEDMVDSAVSRSLGSRVPLSPSAIIRPLLVRGPRTFTLESPFSAFSFVCVSVRRPPYLVRFHLAGTRSPPPHLRAPSPPGARRFSRGSSPGSSPASLPPPLAPRQRPWPERPTNPPRSLSPRGHGDYSPIDSVPQRRGREADSIDTGYGFDTKRRRVDDRDDDLPSRRSSAVDVPPVRGLPARPQTSFPSPTPDDRPRKRAPLPPQSARFREVRHAPVQEPLPLPAPAAEGGRRGYPDLPPRAPREDDAPMRYANVPTDAPPLRRQGPPAITEPEFDGRGRPPPTRPAMTSRPGSRFDDLPGQGPREFISEPMDIDGPPSLPPPRGFEGSSRPSSSMYADRMGDAPGDAPRGPRAMAGGREPVVNVPSQRFPPLETQGPPPPHTSSWNIGSPSTVRGGLRTMPRPVPEVVHALILMLQLSFSYLLPRCFRTLRSSRHSVPRLPGRCQERTSYL